MKPRQPELLNKIFTDDKGNKYEGQRFILIPDSRRTTGYVETEINYLHGKIHGSPAIIYNDGLSEAWENGKFIKILDLPYSQR
jgi:hypothetical protein